MVDKKECQICKNLTKEKYKFYNFWKFIAIVFILISSVFITLYFVNSKVIIKEEITIEQENTDEGSNNEQNNSIVYEVKNNKTVIAIILGSCIISGGVICGCYICKKKSNN